MRTLQAAKVPGIYRCSSDGQTVSCEKGAAIPPCSCGEGVWELLARDNQNPDGVIPVLVGGGIHMVIDMDELPEVGMMLNLRGPQKLTTKYDGCFRIISVGTMRWGGRDQIHIEVERVGEFDEERQIHTMVALNI